MNLKSIYAGCAAMLLVLLSGCASTMKEGGAAFSEAKVEPGKALVYVYRQDAVDGDFVPYVWVTGGRSFDLPNRRYAAVSVPPGKHVVKATWAKRSDLPEAEAAITVEPNQTYYVRVASETHDGAVGKAVVFYMTAKTSVRLVPRDEAMQSLPQTKSAL
jgi:hypothetical protein